MDATRAGVREERGGGSREDAYMQVMAVEAKRYETIETYLGTLLRYSISTVVYFTIRRSGAKRELSVRSRQRPHTILMMSMML